MTGTDGRNGSPQTFYADISGLSFEMIEQQLGYASVIRFTIPDEVIRMGDVLVVLDGQEIRFHGIINSIDKEGWGVASDLRGSRIPFSV
jgi:hypothetical protein